MLTSAQIMTDCTKNIWIKTSSYNAATWLPEIWVSFQVATVLAANFGCDLFKMIPGILSNWVFAHHRPKWVCSSHCLWTGYQSKSADLEGCNSDCVQLAQPGPFSVTSLLQPVWLSDSQNCAGSLPRYSLRAKSLRIDFTLKTFNCVLKFCFKTGCQMTGIAQIWNQTSSLQPDKQVVSVYPVDSFEITQVLGWAAGSCEAFGL